jgi:hypothetical protein
MLTSARRESASGGSRTFVLAVDVTRQPDGAVNVTPLAVVRGVSAESSSMPEFAGWPMAAPAKLRVRASAKTPTQRMRFLHQRDPDLGSTIIRKSGVLAPVLRRVLLIYVLSVSDLSL